jgi:hypothetical protein
MIRLARRLLHVEAHRKAHDIVSVNNECYESKHIASTTTKTSTTENNNKKDRKSILK